MPRCAPSARSHTLGLMVAFVVLLPGVALGQEGPTSRPFGAFAFQDSALVSLPSAEAFDRFVEVDAWWDHRFTEDPLRFFLEPRPGGGFYEIFDEEGNGILHATVIAVQRGELLRMHGPLGLSGFALDAVYTLTFNEVEEGTMVRLDVRGAGELEDGWAEAIQGVWHHFLVERYQAYAQGSLR